MKPVWDVKFKNKCIALYNEGKTITEIASIMQADQRSISFLLQKLKVHKPAKVKLIWTEASKKKFKRLWTSTVPFEVIQQHFPHTRSWLFRQAALMEVSRPQINRYTRYKC